MNNTFKIYSKDLSYRDKDRGNLITEDTSR